MILLGELRANIEDLNRTQHELHKAQAELAHKTRLTTMGELTASIAHEVNQPLTAVVNNAPMPASASWHPPPATQEKADRTALRTLKTFEKRSERYVTMLSARVPLLGECGG